MRLRLFDLLKSRAVAGLIAALAFALILGAPRAYAQDADTGSEMNGPASMSSPTAQEEQADAPPPILRIPIRQPITGSMLVAPPYGTAPLKVGFFVLANDPENIGFLTYQWNFGDGTVSSLPPELYIFHNYNKPGNYVCTLIIKTVDGRSKTFFQGVIVKDAASNTG